jgi:predicted transcriptional regulator
VYKHIHENIKLSEANKLRKQVYDIIKKNNRSNMIELNQKMMDLLQVDKGFMDVVLEKIRLSMEMDCKG